MHRAAFLLVLLHASTATAHHSFAAEYGDIGIADGDWATHARIGQQAVEAIGASHGG